MKAITRRRLETLAKESGLCAGCAAREQKGVEISALAQRLHQTFLRREEEKTPEELRQQARELREKARSLEDMAEEREVDPSNAN